MAAGLWPALEELKLSANTSQFDNLARAIRSGRAPSLRVLVVDGQSRTRRTGLCDVIFSALAAGQCLLIELLSFTDNKFCPEHRIDMLGDALKTCSNLRVLKVDCSQSPEREMSTLRKALEAGYLPRLTRIYARSNTIGGRGPEFRALRRVAEQRASRVRVTVGGWMVGGLSESSFG